VRHTRWATSPGYSFGLVLLMLHVMGVTTVKVPKLLGTRRGRHEPEVGISTSCTQKMPGG
jgi:hypothetical protein